MAAVVGMGQYGAARAACVGDCNGDAAVTVNELVLGVNIALGTAALPQCPSLDANGDGEVAINEIVVAVGNASSSCPAEATATVGPPATATVPAEPTATPTPSDVLFDGTIAALVPHGNGDQLIYRVTEVARITTVTTETETISERATDGTFSVARTSTDKDERLVYLDGGTFLVLRFIENLDLDSRVNTTCSPSVRQLETPLRIGQAIESTAICEVRTIQGGRRLGQYRQDTAIMPVEILPTATVPAGTYQNVIRLTSEVKFSAGSSGSETHEIWLVPGLGLIRDVLKSYGTTETRELLDGTIGGQSVRR
jgi:hypothetical protein